MNDSFLPGMQEIEAERRRKEELRYWWRCLRVAAAKGGTFGMARAMYKQRFDDWPPDDFPCQKGGARERVADLYPKLVQPKKARE